MLAISATTISSNAVADHDHAEATTVAAVLPTSRPAIAPEIAWVLVDDDIVAFKAKGPTVYLLEPTAAMLWQCLDGRTSILDLAHDVADVFGVSAGDAEADVARFVIEMLNVGLLSLPEAEVGSGDD